MIASLNWRFATYASACATLRSALRLQAVAAARTAASRIARREARGVLARRSIGEGGMRVGVTEIFMEATGSGADRGRARTGRRMPTQPGVPCRQRRRQALRFAPG